MWQIPFYEYVPERVSFVFISEVVLSSWKWVLAWKSYN
jgi:hypothetical protein